MPRDDDMFGKGPEYLGVHNIFAQIIELLSTIPANTAWGGMYRHHFIAGLEPSYAFASLLDNTREFMTEKAGHRDQWVSAKKGLQIGTAG